MWTEFKDNAIKEIIDSDDNNFDDLDDDSKKHFRARANTEFHKTVKSHLDLFVKECQRIKEIWLKNDYPFNLGWITDMENEKLQVAIKRYPKLLDILHFIDSQGDHEKSITEADLKSFTARIKRNETEERLYSHVIVNRDFFDKAEKELGIKKITMQKYLQAFSEAGIIEKIKHLQTHGRAMLYIDGYYMKMPNGSKRKIRSLNAKNHRKFLENFSY